MADNGFKINKNLNLNPQSAAPANPIDGDMYYDLTIGSFAYYHSGSWANLDSIATVTAAINITSATLTPTVIRNSVIKLTGSTAGNICGMSAAFAAKKLTIYNASSATQAINNQNVTEATANNRIVTPIGGDMNLVAGEIAQFIYDTTQNRWVLVSISSNASSQLVSTTTNNGIVTLHAASATPSTPTVLTDGDLNAANGVVGLTSNKTATITPGASNITALTVTSLGTGIAISATGGASNGYAISATGGGTNAGIFSTGGSGGAAGTIGVGTGVWPGIYGIGAGGTVATTGWNTASGVPGGVFLGGTAGGDGLYAGGAGTNRNGIYSVATGNGYGIVANSGAGSNAGLFNGNVSITGTLGAGATSVSSLTATGTITNTGFTATSGGAVTCGTIGSGAITSSGNLTLGSNSIASCGAINSTGLLTVNAGATIAFDCIGNIHLNTTNPTVNGSSAQSFGSKVYSTTTRPIAWGVFHLTATNQVSIVDGYNISSATCSADQLTINLSDGSAQPPGSSSGAQLGGHVTVHSASTGVYYIGVISQSSATQVKATVFSNNTGSSPLLYSLSTANTFLTVTIYGTPA